MNLIDLIEEWAKSHQFFKVVNNKDIGGGDCIMWSNERPVRGFLLYKYPSMWAGDVFDDYVELRRIKNRRIDASDPDFFAKLEAFYHES